MATVNIKHNVHGDDESKKYPIVFVIRHKSRHAHIESGIKIEKKFFDEKKWIKRGAPGIIDHTYTNSGLQQKLADIQNFIVRLTMQGKMEEISATGIKRLYLAEQSKEKYNFNTYYKYCISTKQSPKTIQAYQYTLQLIEKYSPVELRFSDVNTKFLREFELWMIDKGMKTNSISIHMRNIRTVLNPALSSPIVN
jgi:hypothetical protein